MIEQTRKENLEKLATYLEALPSDYHRFGMRNWFADENGYETYIDDDAIDSGHVCGTAACAIGHGLAAGVPVGAADSWVQYADNFACIDTQAFEYMFAGTWEDYDDTHQGAAQRIRMYLTQEGDMKDLRCPWWHHR